MAADKWDILTAAVATAADSDDDKAMLVAGLALVAAIGRSVDRIAKVLDPPPPSMPVHLHANREMPR